MGHLYIFNPEHDTALANFTPYYKPTSEIVRMANDLSVLPAWYAEKGAVIKIDAQRRRDRLENQCRADGIFPTVLWSTEYLSMPYRVWGWNPSIIYTLHNAGVKDEFLPVEEWMKEFRCLSGRQTAKKILDDLGMLPYVCGMSEVCDSLEEVKNFIKAHGKTVLKAPWSGSGRGLIHISPEDWCASIEGRVARIIRTQGAIMAEPYYDKILDFAMEFCADSEITFYGYSLFNTDKYGNYKENLLLSNEEIESRLTQYVSSEALHELYHHLESILSYWLQKEYCGYLGVDMMICRKGDIFLIHPCVEVNLRMNMGVISRIFFDRYVHPSSCGRYVMKHYSADGEALRFQNNMVAHYPICQENGRIRHGYLSLTPVFEDTHYQIYIHID